MQENLVWKGLERHCDRITALSMVYSYQSWHTDSFNRIFGHVMFSRIESFHTRRLGFRVLIRQLQGQIDLRLSALFSKPIKSCCLFEVPQVETHFCTPYSVHNSEIDKLDDDIISLYGVVDLTGSGRRPATHFGQRFGFCQLDNNNIIITINQKTTQARQLEPNSSCRYNHASNHSQSAVFKFPISWSHVRF